METNWKLLREATFWAVQVGYKSLLACESFYGRYVYHSRSKLPQASQNRRRTLSHPPASELPGRLVSRVGYVEDFGELRTTLEAVFTAC